MRINTQVFAKRRRTSYSFIASHFCVQAHTDTASNVIKLHYIFLIITLHISLWYMWETADGDNRGP